MFKLAFSHTFVASLEQHVGMKETQKFPNLNSEIKIYIKKLKIYI